MPALRTGTVERPAACVDVDRHARHHWHTRLHLHRQRVGHARARVGLCLGKCGVPASYLQASDSAPSPLYAALHACPERGEGLLRPKGVPGAKRSGIVVPSIRLTVDRCQAIRRVVGVRRYKRTEMVSLAQAKDIFRYRMSEESACQIRLAV